MRDEDPLTLEDRIALATALTVSAVFSFAAIWQIVEWAAAFAKWLTA